MSAKFTFNAKAAADLSAKQYHIMFLSATRTVNQASLATDSDIAGVLTNKPADTEHATIQYGGPGRVTAGAAITAPAYITTNGSGRAVAFGSGDLSMIIGRALESAIADGDVIDCILTMPFRWPGAV